MPVLCLVWAQYGPGTGQSSVFAELKGVTTHRRGQPLFDFTVVFFFLFNSSLPRTKFSNQKSI